MRPLPPTEKLTHPLTKDLTSETINNNRIHPPLPLLHPQVLEVLAEPAGLADQLDRGHLLASRAALPLSRHLRAPRHADLWQQVQNAPARQRRRQHDDAQGQL